MATNPFFFKSFLSIDPSGYSSATVPVVKKVADVFLKLLSINCFMNSYEASRASKFVFGSKPRLRVKSYEKSSKSIEKYIGSFRIYFLIVTKKFLLVLVTVA